jgi:hypothetical protein
MAPNLPLLRRQTLCGAVRRRAFLADSDFPKSTKLTLPLVLAHDTPLKLSATSRGRPDMAKERPNAKQFLRTFF